MMEDENRFTHSPMDLYDIFGYLIPGMVLLIALVTAVLYGIPQKIFNIGMIENSDTILFDKFIALLDAIPWWVEFVCLVLTIATIYIIGHIVASISSLVIDKILIKKMGGYPFERLFQIKSRSRNQFSIGLSKLSFLLINLYILRLLIIPKPRILELCIVLLVFIAFLIAGYLNRRLIRGNLSEKASNRLKMLGKKLSIPFNIFAHFIEHFVGLNESFDANFIQKYSEQFTKTFGLPLDKNTGTNIYWLSYCAVTNESEHLKNMLRHFLRLYGFARNLSTSFYIVFLLVVLEVLFVNGNSLLMKTGGILFFGLSFIMLTRYYYLYYNYYSKIVFRSFVYLRSTVNS